jgi:hypothetical protein
MRANHTLRRQGQEVQSRWLWKDTPILFALMSDGSDHRRRLSPLRAGFSFSLEAMAAIGKSKSGEAGRKVLIARADARASRLAPIVAELRRGGITSWYGISMELNRRGIPTATGRGVWEPGQVRRVMERFEK